MSNQIYICPQCGKTKYFEGICYDCKKLNQSQDTLKLTNFEVEEKVKRILENFNQIEDLGDEYYDFVNLFCYRAIDTERIAQKAFENEVFYPDILYKNASAIVRDKMIDLLKKDDCPEANNIQCALAVLGDEKVLEVFIELQNNPRKWREKLYVDPSIYAHGGGWTFDDNGKKIKLTYDNCYYLEKSEREDNAIKVGQPLDETCEKCGGKLFDILTIDGSDERLKFLGIEGIIKAKVCPDCVMMSDHYFCKYTINGDSEILPNEEGSDESYMTEENIEEFKTNKFVLSQKEVNPYFGCNEDVYNTIGGMPNWVQDPTYLKCPVCGKHMKYFAQLHWTRFGNGDGTLFFEICQECNIIGMLHQQT